MSRILIAEDEPRISAFVEKGLAANGFAVTVVAAGMSAFGYAVTGGFDLLVLDIGPPGMDGFAVLRKLRAERCTIPVIVLTATPWPGWRAGPPTTCPNRSGSRSSSPGCGCGRPPTVPPS